MTARPVGTTMAEVERALGILGYGAPLLFRDYRFADAFARDNVVRGIDLATFFGQPTSYRTACIGAFVGGARRVEDYRALGAHAILEVDEREIRAWTMATDGPRLLDRAEPSAAAELVGRHADTWSPGAIRAARTITGSLVPRQLDIWDTGLIPLIEASVRTKLDQLLRETLAKAKMAAREHGSGTDDEEQLFRLVFRFLAAKLLADRQYPGWSLSNDPDETLAGVEAFYFRGTLPVPVQAARETRRVAWDGIRGSFHLQNISLEALAYVYENTFVTRSLRKSLSIHTTPPEIAEYLLRHLPIQDLPLENRTVFEPFSGHGALLIAALGRLRELLPGTLGPAERHDYLVAHLRGVDKEPFAREIAWLSLILADYPNRNGWRVDSDDVFTPTMRPSFSWANVVVANPPFERFSAPERHLYGGQIGANKAVEALRLTLEHAPAMLGFVLPAPFITGGSYDTLRRAIMDTYRDIEVVALTDTVFQHAEQDTILLTASGHGHPVLSVGAVSDYATFRRTGEVQGRRQAPLTPAPAPRPGTKPKPGGPRAPTFWVPRLATVWGYLAALPVLGDVATVERGLEYRRESRAAARSTVPKPGYRPALVHAGRGFEPFVADPADYLDPDPTLLRYPDKIGSGIDKVIANRARLSRTHWRMAAVPDRSTLLANENFYVLVPRAELGAEVLAAVLNGPVANAFLHEWSTSRNNTKSVVSRVPIPIVPRALAGRIERLVAAYRAARLRWLSNPEDAELPAIQCSALLRQIDAAVLTAYGLPPPAEREILDLFWGEARPGPVRFTGYYPPGADIVLPWRLFASGMPGESPGSADEATGTTGLPAPVDPAEAQRRAADLRAALESWAVDDSPSERESWAELARDMAENPVRVGQAEGE